MPSLPPDLNSPGGRGELPGGMDALIVGQSIFGDIAVPATPVVEGYSSLLFIAQGGLGHVWRARRDVDGAAVALKVPHHPEPTTAERLVAEAQTLRSLDHPHIVRFFDLTEDDGGAPVIVMELVDGPSLTSQLPDTGFDFDHALQILLPVLDAVAHAHSRGVVHRDLKPSNILIAADGTPKVSDFGLAQSLKDRRLAFSLTRSGIVAGTVEYLAPECYEPEAKATAAADIFALGVILYECLAGRPPRGAWRPLSEIKRLDVRLDELVADSIHPVPAARLASTQEFRRRLEEVRDTRPRYAGTPLVTRSVRITDCLWTVAGLYFLAAGFCSLLSMNNTDVPGLFDLTFGHSRLLGGFWTLWIMTIGLGMLWIWQLIRLWWFRHIPVRESLPSPFGLRLGHTSGAAWLVGLTQFLCLWAPLAYMGWICSQCWFWLQPETPVWESVLAVTGADDEVPVSVWTWNPANFFNAGAYYIWELQPATLPGTYHLHDRQSFFIFTQPLSMAAGSAAIALGMTATTVALATEWRRRCVGRFFLFLGTVGLAALGVAETIRFEASLRRDNDGDPEILARHFPAERHLRAVTLVEEIFDSINGNGQPLPDATSAAFDDTVNCVGERGVPRSIFLQRLETQRRQAVASHTTTQNYRGGLAGAVSTGWYAWECKWEHYTDIPGGECTGGFSTLSCRGEVKGDTLVGFIGIWEHEVVPLYRSEPRDPSRDEVVAWLGSFLDALSMAGCPQLEKFFLPSLLVMEPTEGKHFSPVSGAQMVTMLRSSRQGWEALSFRAAADPAVRALPGGRQELQCTIFQQGTRRAGQRANPEPLRWQMELVFVDNRWQIMRLKM